MPIIKVWCLPETSEEKLNCLYKAIVEEVIGVSELCLKSEKDITCLFPADLMKYGLGDEIIIEISGLLEKPERTDDIRQRLAKNIGIAVENFYPEAKIECLVETFNPSQGFWSNCN